MATIKFLLQSNSDNPPIYLRLSISRNKSIKRKIGLNINFKDWSKSTGLPKQNKPDNKNLTADLRDLKNQILKDFNSANSKGIEVNGDWLLNRIDVFFKRISDTNQSELVTDAIQYIIDTAHIRDNGKGGVGLSKCRVNAYKRLKELFLKFESRNKYKIKDLNKKTFDSFKKWLLDKNEYSTTYSFKKLSDLKTVCKDARSNGIETSTEINDIKTKQPSAYEDDMDVIILTEDEIQQIEKANLQSEALINARKWLILACYTGQRGEALTTRITKDNFVKYGSDLIIKIIQKKGNKPVTIPVLPKVREIYEKGMPYKVATQNLNKYFKKIGEIAEVDTPVMGRIIEAEVKGKKRGVKKMRPKFQYLSTHIGRRTFASNHYNKIPTPIIMRVTGHSKESTFLTYINQADDSHIETFLEYYKTKELKEQKKPQLSVVKKKTS